MLKKKRAGQLSKPKAESSASHLSESLEVARINYSTILEKFSKEIQLTSNASMHARYAADSIASYTKVIAEDEETQILSTWLTKFGVIYKQTSEMHTSRCQAINTTLCASLDTFVRDIGDAKASKKQLDKIAAQVDQSRIKVDQLKAKKVSATKIAEAEAELEMQIKLKEQTQQQVCNKFLECEDKQTYSIVKDVWASIRAINDYFQEGSKLLQKYVAQIEQSSDDLEEKHLQAIHERENVTADQFFAIFDNSQDSNSLFAEDSCPSPDESNEPGRKRALSLSQSLPGSASLPTVITSNPLFQITSSSSSDDTVRGSSLLSTSRDDARNKKGRKTPRGAKVPELSLLTVSAPEPLSDAPDSPSGPDDIGGSLSPRQRSARKPKRKEEKGKSKLVEDVNTLPNVLDQFIKKETRYVRLLTAICKNFKQPLLQEPWIKKMGTDDKQLFLNVDEIHTLHSEMLQTLTLLKSKPTEGPEIPWVAFVLKNIPVFIGLMKIYVPNLVKSLQSIEKLKSSKKFCSFIETQSCQSQEYEGLELSALMLQPVFEVQIIYQLLCDLTKMCPPGEQQTLAGKTIDSIQPLKHKADRLNKMVEQLQEVKRIQEKISNCDRNLTDTLGRRIVKIGRLGTVLETDFDPSLGTTAKSFGKVLLFSDLMILTKSAGLTEKKYKMIGREILLYRSKLIDTPDTESEKNMFQIIERESREQLYKYSFYCRYAEEKAEWIAAIRTSLNELAERKLFGISLSKLMASEREKNRLIPSFVQLVVETMIRTKAVQTEGIFRVSGSTASVEKFKDKANQGFDYPDLLTSLDSHSMASVLKLFYRELPEPLLTSELMDQFMTAGKIADEDERIKLLSSTIQQLPLYNKALLQYTMKFFVLTAAYREVNKMHSNNIAICLAPLLLPNSSNDPFDTSGQHAGLLVVQTLIDHYNLIFAETDLDKKTGDGNGSGSGSSLLQGVSSPRSAELNGSSSSSSSSSSSALPEMPQLPSDSETSSSSSESESSEVTKSK